jgi:chromosome partitioning protein
VVVDTCVDGLLLAPSTYELVGAEVELVGLERREHRLRDALDSSRLACELTIVDCPPSLGLLTLNALVAASDVLVPLQAEYYAMEGLGALLQTLDAVRAALNPDVRRAGVLLTMVDRRNNLCRAVAAQARQVLRDEVLRTEIPRNVRLAEAPSHGLPILLHAPASPGANAYQELAAELHGRLATRTPHRTLAREAS